jgi:glycosyltransferase involved in cell wall biosynthesis
VDAVVVCSELDRRRLGASNAVVIPNGYDEPASLPERSPSDNSMIMIGRFTYPPNADGAKFFVREILPRVRAQVPDAHVRLIGRDDGHLDDLRGVQGVEVTGEVEDVAEELGRARIAVIPLRAGSGTRLKVLEAFAYQVPVVSTSLGCEGLDVTANRHLLVGDSPDTFANACVTLLTNDELRERVADDAQALFESRYRWVDIRGQIGDLVHSLTDSAPTSANGR